MEFLKRLLGKAKGPDKLFVLGLDGVPHSLVAGPQGRHLMPYLSTLLQQGALGRMNSVLPTVSTVAWATAITGSNPGKHGIFGFVDRSPNPFTTLVPTARDLKTPTMFELASRGGRKLGIINVPMTYPPKPLSGFMVAGFLSPDIAGATFPADLAPRLVEMDYRVDVDTSLAAEDRMASLADMADTMSRRFNAALQLMETEPWDYFHLHIMAADRLNHFFWGDWEDKVEGAAEGFEAFYRRLDSHLAELVNSLPSGCHFLMASEHGFTRSKGRVFINHWLEKNGYLLFSRGRRELKNMHPESRAYSLVPGRVYINLEGREERGFVAQGRAYEDLREELTHRLSGLTHPETSQPLVAKVHRREDLYRGPHLSRAPDLVIEPVTGYDLKANLEVQGLVGPPDVSGVHTSDDAFLFIQGARGELEHNKFGLESIAPTVLQLLDIAPPPSMDGKSLI